ncbi:MAG: DinB family protein [Ktedonobacterales bacterium]
MPTRDQITAALATQRERVERWFRALSDDEMQRPLTKSEVEGGAMWTPKDHLAHIVGTERYFQGVIRRALEGAADPCGFFTVTGHDGDEARLAVANPANEQARAKYADQSAEALFGRIEGTRQATLAQLAGVDDAQLTQPVPHSPFGDGSLGALFMTIALHSRQHLGWLDEARAAHEPEQSPQS